MMGTPNSSTTERIRQAIAFGEFQQAERLWNRYVAELKEELRHGSLNATSLDEARLLVEWSRRTILCLRAHARGRLGSLRIAGAYSNQPASLSARLIQTNL